MAKKAPFFSHDMNARHDPKVSAMRGVYGAEGYGWFWMLIEMMAESDEYKLDCKSKYTFGAYAMQLQCNAETLQQFVTDCITEFDLFESDSMYFWSKSLRNRMRYRDKVSEKRSEAANKRWENHKENANASNNDANASESDANAMQNYANKTKLNKTLKDIVDSDECDQAFEQVWKLYPNKKGSKQKTLTKWRGYWKKKLIDMEKVIAGTNAYVQYVDHRRKNGFPDLQYKNADTFFNNQTWNDDWSIPSNSNIPTNSTPKTPFQKNYKTAPVLDIVTLSQEEDEWLERAEREQFRRNHNSRNHSHIPELARSLP